MSPRRVCVLGLGYVGLPLAAWLANRGFDVRGVDVDEDKVAAVNGCRVRLVEPELDAFVRAAVCSGRLVADAAPAPAEVFIIAVPTPFTDDHVPDVSHVLDATAAIAPLLTPGDLVVLESTAPVGTTERVRDELLGRRPELRGALRVAHAPERVLPGRIIQELAENDRVVGGIDAASTEAARSFYASFVQGRVHTTDARTAELSKLAENSYRDVNIAFANELSLVCEDLGVDVRELIRIANHHPRVDILDPGAGVGGHCIAVDPWFIIHSAPRDTALLRTARHVNQRKTARVVEQVLRAASELRAELGREPTVALLGLAYKPDVDDLRESPALEIARAVEPRLSQLRVVEPHLSAHDELALTPLDEATRDADLVVVLVAHRQFAGIEPRGRVLDVVGALAGS